MGANSKIEWTHHTFNPWWGCQRVSEGCALCYAEAFAKRVGQRVWGPDSGRRFFGDKRWNEPRKWNRVAEANAVRHRVFCASMADVFEDRSDLDPWREKLWPLIEETRSLDWLLLTKRPEHIAGLTPSRWWRQSFPPNVWVGATVENQKRADERIPVLLDVPAVVRFLSCEPLLEEIDIVSARGSLDVGPEWVVIGGESGHGARPFHIEWARSLLRQCEQLDAAPFVKQLGARPVIPAPLTDGLHGEGLLAAASESDREWPDGTHFGNPTQDVSLNGRVALLRDKKGGDMAEWPAALRVREFPGG